MNTENESIPTIVTAADVAPLVPREELNNQFLLINAAMAKVAAREIRPGQGNVFVADLEKGELFAAYLNSMPEDVRQEYNCHCCRRFLNEVGALVRVDPKTGATRSLLWDEAAAPPAYVGTIRAMRELVESRKIAFIFRRHSAHARPMYGKIIENGWTHMALSLSEIKIGDFQYEPGRSGYEEYKLLAQHQADLDLEQLRQAATYFEHDPQLKNYPQHLASLNWWIEFKKDLADRSHVRKNLLWLATATQPIGRLRLKTKVTGTFIQEIAAHRDLGFTQEKAFEAAKKQFLAMVDPRDYQRPKTAAAAATIKQAEDLVASLNLTSAMERRSLRFDELPEEIILWKPAPVEETKPAGVFGHLTPANETKPAVTKPNVDGGKLTFSRFLKEVLPGALSIQIPIDAHRYLPWASLNTAVHADAEPILKWDTPERRHPVSAFNVQEQVQIPGSRPVVWKLPIGQKVGIKAVIPAVENWYGTERDAVMLVVDAGEVPMVALGLFPEILRPELHPVRKVMEQFSNAGRLADREQGMVALTLNTKFDGIGLDFFVDNGKAIVKYHVDRGE